VEDCTQPCRQVQHRQSQSVGTEAGVFFQRKIVVREKLFWPGASFPLQEQPLRTKLKICTEADYLQAHLTFIVRESRHWNPALRSLKQRVTSILKKWTARSIPLPGLRATNMSGRFFN